MLFTFIDNSFLLKIYITLSHQEEKGDWIIREIHLDKQYQLKATQ